MSLAAQIVAGESVPVRVSRDLQNVKAKVLRESLRVLRAYRTDGWQSRSVDAQEALLATRTGARAVFDPGDGAGRVEITIARFGDPMQMRVVPSPPPAGRVFEKQAAVHLGFGTGE